MAMVAGRYPVFPEAAIFSTRVLDKWGQTKVSVTLAGLRDTVN